jgi:hypothetical protein
LPSSKALIFFSKADLSLASEFILGQHVQACLVAAFAGKYFWEDEAGDAIYNEGKCERHHAD